MSQIEELRRKKRPEMLETLQGYQQELNEKLSTSINRNKFLNKFYLYGGFSKKLASSLRGTKSGFGDKEILETMVCSKTWPVCLLDFSYKNKLPECFVFLEADLPQKI
eukprot:CAMPEP_0202978470 /NCGR_PEP_ID=MMETSP1396-20130829/84876_1 /ASSEMBLY_ACC=CAM_ASM_000872 /TAXON_ID= /ORGANISM="Pseudokeronopsis sp., Strain Brazil" /LENGTH=107 /DNA_ID=CAMNT_0049717437 /DNA_START=871 /DNA_END=1194 /DNA_ORIENTATION=-